MTLRACSNRDRIWQRAGLRRQPVCFWNGSATPQPSNNLPAKQLTVESGQWTVSFGMTVLRSDEIKQAARELGFEKVGIVPATALTEEGARLRQWLERHFH